MTPRLLLVEDDPVSRLFLSTVLESLPAQVRAAGSVAEALAGEIPPDLWLIDANLPDGSGPGLLAELRRRLPSTPALAHTADATLTAREQLLAAGFAAVLIKPLQAETVLAAVREALGRTASDPILSPTLRPENIPVWDNALALAALKGNAGNVAALRGLFLDELQKQHAAILAAAAAGDLAALRHELHRLKASCGFVGAARLQAAAEAYDRAPAGKAQAADFNAAIEATLAQ